MRHDLPLENVEPHDALRVSIATHRSPRLLRSTVIPVLLSMSSRVLVDGNFSKTYGKTDALEPLIQGALQYNHVNSFVSN